MLTLVVFLCGCSSYVSLSEEYYPESVQRAPAENKKNATIHKTANGLREISKDGLVFKSTTTVSLAAFKRAYYVTQKMLTYLPQVKRRLSEMRYKIVIIPNNTSLTDMSEYEDFKGKTFHQRVYGQRDFDNTRGLAEYELCAVTERGLIQPDVIEGSNMVHEFAHAIHMHMDREDNEEIYKAYNNAKSKHLYPMNIYLMENYHEYWAMVTEAWFGVGKGRYNADISSRAKLVERDPKVAAILARAYGDVEISFAPMQ